MQKVISFLVLMNLWLCCNKQCENNSLHCKRLHSAFSLQNIHKLYREKKLVKQDSKKGKVPSRINVALMLAAIRKKSGKGTFINDVTNI